MDSGNYGHELYSAGVYDGMCIPSVGDRLIDLTEGAYLPVLSIDRFDRGGIIACPVGIGHLICDLEGRDHPLRIICHPGIYASAGQRASALSQRA